MASEALEAIMARMARRAGVSLAAPARGPGRTQPTHGTAAEIVAAEIARGNADAIPSGLLERAGVTRDGRDAAGEALARATAAAGVPEAFRDVPPDAGRVALFDADEPRGVWVSGAVGTGKTRCACAWLRGWLAAHPGGVARYVSEADLLGHLHAAMSTPSSDPDAVLAAYELADLLVVDDVGQGRPGQWDVSQLFRLVDSRWAGMRPTVWTSNLSLPDWGGRLAAASEPTARAIVSRVAGSCDQVVTDGMDRRVGR